ncbi:MAG: DUF2098 domain-containing protein [Methanospirillum sp.]|nr:DUF2098 domain-containing protein [Methanospirillum sp.]
MIDIGSYARYPKTGTVGTVVRFHEQIGETFAELDSTGLLYRLDQLIPATREEKRVSERTGEDLKILVRERESLLGSEYDDAVTQQDGACHGGG